MIQAFAWIAFELQHFDCAKIGAPTSPAAECQRHTAATQW